MNWSEIGYDWNQARAVLATVELGSLSAAARALGVAQPTLGRQVAALEDRLGVALFERAGRGLEPTGIGRELAAAFRDMAEAAGRAAMLVAAESTGTAGLVRVACSEAEAVWLLPRAIERLRRRAPDLRIAVVASTALADLRHREADLALRSVAPDDPSLVARRLGTVRHRLYATPACLAAAGDPADAAALSRAPFVGFDEGPGLGLALAGLGLTLPPERFVLLAASQPVQWALVRQGLGVGLMPERIGDGDPALVRPEVALAPIETPLWLVAHRDLQRSPRLRLVADALADVLAPETIPAGTAD